MQRTFFDPPASCWPRRWLHGAALALALAGTQGAAEVRPALSLGRHFALALAADGQLLSWGRNDFGQLGNGQAALQSTPQPLADLGEVVALAAGDSFSLALRADGTVWAWGSNSSGELGDGSRLSKAYPVPVTGLPAKIKAISAGVQHGLALADDGSVWHWGLIWQTTATDAAAQSVVSPRASRVAGLPPIQAIGAGQAHSLALANDGSVWSWGDNAFGQLGSGSGSAAVAMPQSLPFAERITAISSAAFSNLVLDAKGQVWAWGMGGWGALGDGTDLDRPAPVRVVGLPAVQQVVAGNLASLALAQDGSVWMWGNNDYGSFAASGLASQWLPANMPHLRGYRDFALGENQVLARHPDGSLRAWGYNAQGELGVGDTQQHQTPTPVLLPLTAQRWAVGLSHSLAQDRNGQLWAWGSNGSGQLGFVSDVNRNTPQALAGLTALQAVSAGAYHALALRADGTLLAWGLNNNGELGDGSRRNALTPQPVPGLSGVQQAAAGSEYSLALDQHGQVWSWGLGSTGIHGPDWAVFGALETPQPVAGIDQVQRIAAGFEHALALRSDGSVWAWGSNSAGQLGPGSRQARSTPQPVAGPVDAVAVAAGRTHSLALGRSGVVWAWGSNARGALGDGSNVDADAVLRVANLPPITAIAAGDDLSCALDADGRVWSWGEHSGAGLGRPVAADFDAHAGVVPGLEQVLALACASQAGMALRHDGTLLAWGRNFEGQLGDATLATRSAAVVVVNPDASAPLDLDLTTANDLAAAALPPFYALTRRSGALNRLSLAVDLRLPSASLGPTRPAHALAGPAAARADTSARYNLYVAASVPATAAAAAQSAPMAAAAPIWLQLDSQRQWQALSWPMAEFMRQVAASAPDALLRLEILEATDLSAFAGSNIWLGYGTDAQEMIRSARYRNLFSVPID